MKTSNLSADNFRKILGLDGSTPEPAIRSSDTGQGIRLLIDHNIDGQSAKTADWLVDNDVVWPVLRNCACANPGKLKIDGSMAAERERAMLNYKDLQDCCS